MQRTLRFDRPPAVRGTCTALLLVFLHVLPIGQRSARAGVINPDISLIGQPSLRFTDVQGNPGETDSGGRRVRLSSGEIELVFDANLNPYARGTVVLAVAEEEGLEVEEGYFEVLRRLPAGLAVKGGKYRAGFGKLNSIHPHALPFAQRFHVSQALLPGEESLNETGVSLSGRIPMPGAFSLVASVDYLQGDSFRLFRDVDSTALGEGDPVIRWGEENPDRSLESRPALLGRLSGFQQLGERSGLEVGLSAVHGTNNVAAAARTTVLGVDLKAKLWNSERSYLLVQAEAFRLRREDAGWDPDRGYFTETVDPAGAFLFADYNFGLRYNAGLSFERFQIPSSSKSWNDAFGLFAGFSLMEETTAFRLDWNHLRPGGSEGEAAGLATDELKEPFDPVNAWTLRVIYSMGPHKAHQF